MKPPARSTAASQTEDTVELEALFDSIAASSRRERDEAPASAAQDDAKVISQVGQLTRKLHDALRELGYDGVLRDTTHVIPDTRERLAYVSTIAEQAAVRVLNAIETAKPIQDRLGADASALAGDWERVFNRELSVDEFKALAQRTRAYLARVPVQTQAASAQLMDIMLAQDFQDLSGQVIKKVSDVVQDIESQLLRLLLENCPPERREAAQSLGRLNGPAIRTDGGDVVTSQAQVDELLESLGF